MLPLPINDIDVFFGEFTEDDTKRMIVHKSNIKKYPIDGISVEVNTVKCTELSPDTFLANNDVNITASCILVEYTSPEEQPVLTMRASPCFWTFLMQKLSDKIIQPVNTINIASYSATTCVRIAFKAYQLGEYNVKYSFANIDPTKGTIAASQKEKIDRMKVWPESPFHEYQCNKCRTYYVIASKHKKTTCAGEDCLLWANKSCSHVMCKKCCIKQEAACRMKSHKKPPAGAPEAESDVDMEDFNDLDIEGGSDGDMEEESNDN